MGVYDVGILGKRDQSTQSTAQCTSMLVENQNVGRLFCKIIRGFSVTIFEQWTASHFVLKCTTCACRWRTP